MPNLAYLYCYWNYSGQSKHIAQCESLRSLHLFIPYNVYFEPEECADLYKGLLQLQQFQIGIRDHSYYELVPIVDAFKNIQRLSFQALDFENFDFASFLEEISTRVGSGKTPVFPHLQEVVFPLNDSEQQGEYDEAIAEVLKLDPSLAWPNLRSVVFVGSEADSLGEVDEEEAAITEEVIAEARQKFQQVLAVTEYRQSDPLTEWLQAHRISVTYSIGTDGYDGDRTTYEDGTDEEEDGKWRRDEDGGEDGDGERERDRDEDGDD